MKPSVFDAVRNFLFSKPSQEQDSAPVADSRIDSDIYDIVRSYMSAYRDAVYVYADKSSTEAQRLASMKKVIYWFSILYEEVYDGKK